MGARITDGLLTESSDDFFKNLSRKQQREIVKAFKEINKKVYPNRSHVLWSEPNFVVIYDSNKIKKEQASELGIELFTEQGYSVRSDGLEQLGADGWRVTPFIWSDQDTLVSRVKSAAAGQLDPEEFKVESSFILNNFSTEVEARFWLSNYAWIKSIKTARKLNKISTHLYEQFPARTAGTFRLEDNQLVPYKK